MRDSLEENQSNPGTEQVRNREADNFNVKKLKQETIRLRKMSQESNDP